jgi:ketosteroid isomerase-like protein
LRVVVFWEVSIVSENGLEGVVRGFGEAFVARDVERMLSFFADDAVWVSPVGTFKGKDGLRRVLTWDTQISPWVKARRFGIDIMVKGNKAVSESVSESAYEEKKFEMTSITVFEFRGDKIQHIRLYYDKLSITKQVVMQYRGVSGWFAKRLVNLIVGRAEKGLAK